MKRWPVDTWLMFLAALVVAVALLTFWILLFYKFH